MLGGFGPHPARRPRALGLVAGIVLVLVLVVTGRTLSGSRLPSSAQPPEPTAAPGPYRVGERLACPLTHPVLATADGRSYPLGHPARPARPADPVACYHTAAEAAAAGYAEAPLPAGALKLDGVYLIPVGDRVLRQCRQAARRLGLVVPCPSLRPVPSPGSAPPAVCPRPACGGSRSGFLLEDSGFLVPSGYVGAYPEVGRRLVVAAASRPAAATTACPGERPLGRARIRGAGGSLFQCPPGAGPHGGGLLLRWRERGTVMVVSVTGNLAAHLRLLLALAGHLTLMPPKG